MTTTEGSSPRPGGALAEIVRLAGEALPRAEQLSLTVPTPDGWMTAAATGPLARMVDAVQYETGEGPCLAAARQGRTVVVPDLSTETRWPAFTARMAGHAAVRSMLSIPLRIAPGMTGSLNAAASAPGALDDQEGVGAALATLAGLGLAAGAQRDRADNRAVQLESVVALLVHDLRSGMTVARTAGEFLAGQRHRLDPEGQEALDLLADELVRQHGLLTEMVDLVRAELPSTRAGALLPQVEHVAGEHRRPVAVEQGPGAAEAVVRMHPVRLRRILANLLHNADRHGGGATCVRVVCHGNRASVAVEDAGPGVPAQSREGIFNRLAPASTGEQGSHLGLALCRLHARLAGGDLSVEDRPGGGARFVLELPTAGTVDTPTLGS